MEECSCSKNDFHNLYIWGILVSNKGKRVKSVSTYQSDQFGDQQRHDVFLSVKKSSPRLHLCSLRLAKIRWNHSFLHTTRCTMKAGRRKNDDTPKWLSENEVNASKLTLFQYISGNITLAAFFIACLKKTLTIHYSCIKEKPRTFPETIRCLPLKGLCHLILANELNMLLRTFHGLLALWKVDCN